MKENMEIKKMHKNTASQNGDEGKRRQSCYSSGLNPEVVNIANKQSTREQRLISPQKGSTQKDNRSCVCGRKGH